MKRILVLALMLSGLLAVTPLTAQAQQRDIDYDWMMNTLDTLVSQLVEGFNFPLAGVDNDLNGIPEQETLRLLSSILRGGPRVAGLDPAFVTAIQADFAANRPIVDNDLRVEGNCFLLQLAGYPCKLTDILKRNDVLGPVTGAVMANVLLDFFGGLVTVSDNPATFTFINRFIDAIVDAFVASGAVAGFESIVEGSKPDLRLVASKYRRWGANPSSGKQDKFGPAGDLDADGANNLTEYQANLTPEAFLTNNGIVPSIRIIQQPIGGTVPEGGDIDLTVVFTGGEGPFTFQWEDAQNFADQDIPTNYGIVVLTDTDPFSGTTTAVLHIENITPAQNGIRPWVRISDGYTVYNHLPIGNGATPGSIEIDGFGGRTSVVTEILVGPPGVEGEGAPVEGEGNPPVEGEGVIEGEGSEGEGVTPTEGEGVIEGEGSEGEGVTPTEGEGVIEGEGSEGEGVTPTEGEGVVEGEGQTDCVNEVLIDPISDAVLYEDQQGDVANGAGSFLFVGTTADSAQSNARRTVIEFDIAGSLPEGATIISAQLELNATQVAQNTTFPISLNRVTQNWNEGPTDPANEEAGAPAQGGDVTWLYTDFDATAWIMPGGDFLAVPSATTDVAGTGIYTWGGTGVLTDVQSWQSTPGTNFGWILVGNEADFSTVKRFNSVDVQTADDEGVGPKLRICFEPPVIEGEGVLPVEGEGTTPTEGEGVGPEGEGVTPPEGEGVTPTEGEGVGPEGEGVTPTEGEGVGPEGEGVTPVEGEGDILEGEGEEDVDQFQTADTNNDNRIDVGELLRIIQFYNSDGFHCNPLNTEDGFDPGPGLTTCEPHGSDYNPTDFRINLAELLRVIQFYNSEGYHACPGDPLGENGYCLGLP